MSEMFCISREGSYSSTVYAYYIDSSIDNDQNEFSAYPVSGGNWRTYKKPVGVVYYNSENGVTYLSVYGYNITLQTLFWYEDSTKRTKSGGIDNPHVIGTTFGVQKTLTFGAAVPFFNNDDDASAYSRGAEYDASNWVGGKPLTPISNEAGAGSGYIGNSLLSNKKMVGYNVPTSSAEGTKTESVNDVSASAVSGKPKSGNGFARIKFLGDVLAILKLETYGTTIYGQFNIPSKNVQNKTVVAKANGVPANIADGIAFSLSSYDGNPFRMTGFSANTHYYFVIFDETPNASRPKSNIIDITTPASVNVLMDSDSRYIDNTMLDYSIVNQSTLSQNWYHYDSSNVYYYKNNYYNSGHSYLIFNNVINTGSYKYICVDAEIYEGSKPSAADQHWNYLASAIVLASDGTPICKTNVDEVTNAHKSVYMTRWDTFIPANNEEWLATGKLPRYMVKIPIDDIPNTDIRLVVYSCDAKNRVYGVLLEE